MNTDDYCETCGNDYSTCERINADECNEVEAYNAITADIDQLIEARAAGEYVLLP